MRVLLLIAAIVILLALLGWVSFSYVPGRSSINLETQQIRQDTNEMVETGSKALHDANGSLDTRDLRQEPADDLPPGATR